MNKSLIDLVYFSRFSPLLETRLRPTLCLLRLRVGRRPRVDDIALAPLPVEDGGEQALVLAAAPGLLAALRLARADDHVLEQERGRQSSLEQL